MGGVGRVSPILEGTRLLLLLLLCLSSLVDSMVLPRRCPAPSTHQPWGGILPWSPSPPWEMGLEGRGGNVPTPSFTPSEARLSLEGARAPIWGET